MTVKLKVVGLGEAVTQRIGAKIMEYARKSSKPDGVFTPSVTFSFATPLAIMATRKPDCCVQNPNGRVRRIRSMWNAPHRRNTLTLLRPTSRGGHAFVPTIPLQR